MGKLRAALTAYVYSEDRKAIRPAAHLAQFGGVLQVDGYNGFKVSDGPGPFRA